MKRFIGMISAAAALLTGLGAYAQDYGTAAVSTATGDDLYKRVETNLTNTFTGAFTGLTVLHGTGEPGSNTASYLIRGMGSYAHHKSQEQRQTYNLFLHCRIPPVS